MKAVHLWRFGSAATLPLALAMVAWGGAATAQTANAPEAAAGPQGTGIEEVVVTAQRRSQSLNDVPVAVSVVSGATLEQDDLKTLTAIAARLPNVQINSGLITNFLDIRGVGSGNNTGFEQSVATFVDGINRPRARSLDAALFDIDQLEVLKGPQTTFFGANAIAGALNITTKKPSQEFSYDGTALYGSYGEYNLEGGVTVPPTDTLSFRAAVREAGSGGYIKDGDLGSGPDSTTAQGRFSVRWEPSADFRSDFRIEGENYRATNAYPFSVIGCPTPAPFPAAAATSTCGLALAYSAAHGTPLYNGLGYSSNSPPTFNNYTYLESGWTNALQLAGGTLTSTSGFFIHHNVSKINQAPLQMTVPTVPVPIETSVICSISLYKISYNSRTTMHL